VVGTEIQGETGAALEPLESRGRDEMNLAEFPISALTDYLPKGQNTIGFSDGAGSLMITGSDAYGLPTAADADVVVALIQLTKQRNNFHEPSVTFTRTELLNILGWPESGKSYRRLTESLLRWSTTSLKYEGTWWDNRARRKISAVFHILNEVVLYDRAEPGRGAPLPLSYFTWNKIFLESCQAGNLKRLDVRMYFALEHASTKRLYRFLDKRLHRLTDQTFDLAEIAFERVGLSRAYVGKKGGLNIGKVREKLQPAIDELEARGFLVPLARLDRYKKEGAIWRIRFVRATPKADEVEEMSSVAPDEASVQDASAEPAILDELVRRGVIRAKARALALAYQGSVIARQIEVFDWKLARSTRGMEKNPAGWLVKAIEDGYPAPKGFESQADRTTRLEWERKRDRDEIEVVRRKRDERTELAREHEAVEHYIASLDTAAFAGLEAEALAAAPEETRLHLQSPKMARFRKALVREHVAEKLRREKMGPTLF
jgi:hypothetical protein